MTVLNRVRETTATTGTGTVTLTGAVTDASNGDAQTFTQAGAAGEKKYNYLILDGHHWEIGIGMFLPGPPETMTREVIQSSAGGTTPINLSGSAIIECVALSKDYNIGDTGFNTITGSGSYGYGLGLTVSANYSLAVGTSNRISGQSNFATGNNNVMSGNNSIASGQFHSSTAPLCSAMFGQSASDRGIIGVFAVGGASSGFSGANQLATYALGGSTLDATPTVLTTDFNAPGSNNMITLPDHSCFRINAIINGMALDGDVVPTGEYLSKEIEFIACRKTGADTIQLLTTSPTTPHVVSDYRTGSAGAWTADVSVDTTAGTVKITVTAVGTSFPFQISWQAIVTSCELAVP